MGASPSPPAPPTRATSKPAEWTASAPSSAPTATLTSAPGPPIANTASAINTTLMAMSMLVHGGRICRTVMVGMFGGMGMSTLGVEEWGYFW
ncbi:hypothetical protein ACSBR2_012051 [Camellia fascicularis]